MELVSLTFPQKESPPLPKKVCLITPPSPFLLEDRVFVALGILKIAAVLEERGVQVDHLDLCGVSNFEEVVRNYEGADVFGITSTTPQYPSVMRIVKTLREQRGRKIIIGGPHSTLIHSSYKRGRTRADFAMNAMLETFDVIVAGDGEDAIFSALDPTVHGIVDADDPKSILWQTNQKFTEAPWPARHMVDIESYHYSIDGARALHVIGQLGCLAPDTPIVLSSGIEVPISEVKRGDHVISYDLETNRPVTVPVAETYQREADDIWEITWDNGATLQITGEHPIYTRLGWKTIDEVEAEWFSASLPSMRREFSSLVPSEYRKVLRTGVPLGVAEDQPQHNMATCGTGKNAGEICGNDAGRTDSLLRSSSREHAGGSQDKLAQEDGRFESHEASRGSCESVSYNQVQMGRVLLSTSEGELEKRKVKVSIGCATEHVSEQARTDLRWRSQGIISGAYLRWKRSILGRSLPLWKTTESGLGRYETEKGDSSTRRILAHEGRSGDRPIGLHEQGLATADNLDEGTSDYKEDRTFGQTPILWSRITSKRFIGKGTVHNITVHPVHNYIANGMLVHNCPYMCTFCAGRNSSMLRRIRQRDHEDIIREILHIHSTYGYTGINFFDDELNVNKSMIDLMKALRREADRLGIEWKLRGFVKSNLFTEEQADVMYDAGFRWLLIGFESGSDRILTNIEKKATRAQNTRCMEIAKKRGIKIKALMSLGHAGESYETVQETYNWLIETEPEELDVTVITPYPGSPYWDDAEPEGDHWCFKAKNGDKLYMNEVDFTQTADYYKGCPGEYVSHVWSDYISPEELVAQRDWLETESKRKLGIKMLTPIPAIQFEASMGMTPMILRSSK